MKRIALVLLCALACAFSVSAFSQSKKDKAAAAPPPAIPENLAPADVDALLSQLTDAQARQVLARQLRTQAERNVSHEPRAAGGLDQVLVRIRRSLEGSSEDVGQRGTIVAEGWAQLPEALRASLSSLTTAGGLSGVLTQAAALLALLGAGAVVHWAVRRHFVARHARADPPPGAPFGTRLAAALVHFALEFMPFAAFALVTVWLTHLLFTAGSADRTFQVAYLTGVLLIWAAAMLLRLMFAPRYPTTRLLHLDDAAAGFLYRWLLWVVGASIFLWLTVGLLAPGGMPDRAQQVLIVITGAIVTAVLIAMIVRCRAPVAAAIRASGNDHGHGWRSSVAAFWHYFAILYVVATFLLWTASMLDGKPSAVWAAVASVGVLLVYPLLDRWIGRGIDDMLSSGAPDTEARRHEIGRVLHRVMRVLLVILLFAGIHELWDFELFDAAGARIRQVVVSASVDLAAAILLAVLGWQLIKTGIDRNLAAREVNGVMVEPTMRARTLLPLARKFLVVVLVVMTVMLLLSAIGVNIGPLLAGAGVIGLAIGFGAQTLVRDIITGVFLLLDDAFRVGEYIVSGTYKGTVEEIGIRAVKLRHHRGPLYTVPFSELRGVQNQSRDWVIDKFSIGITYDSDIEKARKLIKKIGEKLAADPEHAPHIMEPMKMQGVDSFGDFAIQVRVKMKTRPGEQFVIRRKANAMIKKAFDENGIKFASPTVMVSGGEAAGVSNAAAAAAASQANKPPPPE